MGDDDLRRRSFLAGATAAVAALAGCGGNGDRPTASDARTDTTAMPTETDTPTPGSLAAHDHSGPDAGGGALAPGELHGVVYAAAMDGDDLSAKVRAALEAVPPGGTVVLTPRPDGEPWIWSETVRINLNGTRGVSIVCRGMTMIEYPGDGWAIETTYEPAAYGANVEGDQFELRGGHWRATGNPEGWLHMTDTNHSEIHPRLVIDFTNDERTATGVRVECDELFCESNVYSGRFGHVDVGMDFVPGEYSEQLGFRAASFTASTVRDVRLFGVRRAGFRWRDGAKFLHSVVVNPATWTDWPESNEEIVLYDISGDHDGTVFLGPRIEDGGAAQDDRADANDVGYKLRADLQTPPLFIAPKLDSPNIDPVVDREDESKRLPALRVDEVGHAGIEDLGRPGRGVRTREGRLTFPTTELLGAGSAEPTTEGQVVYHDGSGDVPKGLYRADPENSRWVFVEDNSVTVPD